MSYSREPPPLQLLHKDDFTLDGILAECRKSFVY